MLTHGNLRCLALAVAMGISVCPAGAQLAKAQKQQAAAGQSSQSGRVPLRVMLYISDAVRGYRETSFLAHFDFGPRLAKEAEKVFNDSFASVQVVSAVPADPHALDAIDMIVSIESPRGNHQAAFFSYSETLSATFVVRRPNGQEIFRAQEMDTEKGSGNPGSTQDQLGEAVTRKFIQELILNPGVRNLLAPAPPPEVKEVRDDSASLASAGLDVAPPPPWGETGGTGSAGSARRPGPNGRP